MLIPKGSLPMLSISLKIMNTIKHLTHLHQIFSKFFSKFSLNYYLVLMPFCQPREHYLMSGMKESEMMSTVCVSNLQNTAYKTSLFSNMPSINIENCIEKLPKMRLMTVFTLVLLWLPLQ